MIELIKMQQEQIRELGNAIKILQEEIKMIRDVVDLLVKSLNQPK